MASSSALVRRSCEALVLAYSPEIVLWRDESKKKFYIPERDVIRKSFNSSLIDVFGEELEELEASIFYGTKDCFSMLKDYLSSSIFEQIGPLENFSVYRFNDEKERGEVFSNFVGYWNSEQADQWFQIWEAMNKYTKNIDLPNYKRETNSPKK
jgi:hypothetical protein